MRNNRLASFSVAAVDRPFLTLGGAGCGDLKDIADEILSHQGDGSGGAGGAGGSGGASGSDGRPRLRLPGEDVLDFGSSFPSTDGCNVCSCDEKAGVACTLKACAGQGTLATRQSCEKVPVAGANGAIVVPFDHVGRFSSERATSAPSGVSH